MCGCAMLLHLFTNAGKLACNGFTCICYIKSKYRFCRKRRSVFPDKIDQVMLINNLTILCIYDFFIILTFFHANYASIKSQSTAFRELLFQIFQNFRNTRLSHSHQFHGAAFQLGCGLDKVSSIYPKACFCRCNDRCSCRSCKSCDKSAGFKMFSYILCLVKIRCWDNIKIDSLLCHFLT